MNTIFRTLKKRYVEFLMYRVYENVNNTAYGKQCLLLYITNPFAGKKLGTGHHNRWLARELARVISEFGYNVDVINYDDHRTRLKKKYDLVVDIHPGLNDAYQDFMSDGCLKVAYITGSNPSFSSQAEMERIENCFKRRGVRLEQRRYVKPFDRDILESFDAMFFKGNAHNLRTFSEFDIKRVFFIRNRGYDFLGNRDCSRRSSENFLFLGGYGQVLRGLDLLLEVFSANKHLNLYVCSNFRSERDFCDLYHEELFHSDNIFPVGFIDVRSKKFNEICRLCSYVVLPSASEGMSGSVLAGMSAGLVPIVSHMSGYDDDEVHIFDDCSIENISQKLNSFARKTPEWIGNEALKTMRIVQERYREEDHTSDLRTAMKGLLSQ